MIRGTVAIVRQVVARQPKLLLAVLAGNVAIAGLLLFPLDYGQEYSWLFNAAHVPAFFLVTLLWIVLFDRAGVSFWLTCAAALLIGGALALGTEVAQYVVPHRWPDKVDLVLDLVGVLGALAAYAAWSLASSEHDA